MPPTTHRRVFCLALMLATIAAGLLWRLAPLHLPWFAYKYGGSVLWAIALYWLLAAALARHPPFRLALLAALVAAALEFSRLDHHLDAFRLTLPGKILLGRIFGLRNIAAYWLGILAAALLDHSALTRNATSRHSKSNRPPLNPH